MKVLLATLSIENDSRQNHHHNTPYSLGLAYIYSVLEREGHEIELLFLNGYDEKESDYILFECIGNFNPDVVAFQIFSMNRISTFKAIEKLNILFPKTRVIIGGVHTSVMYEQIIEKYAHVIAVIGEGEYTVKELIFAFQFEKPLNEISGIAYCDKGVVIRTNPRELISDLDLIPYPKHEVFFAKEPLRTVAHIITSRGCPFDCSFCCLKVISKRQYRKRNINHVVDEIKYLKEKYPRLKHIAIHDDTFLLDNQRVIQFCKLVIDAELNITFECSARVKPVSSEMFSWMERAGFIKVMFGLETGSEKLLKSTNKNITPGDVVDLFYILKQFKFNITTFLMCGFPGENNETIDETIKLVQTIQKIHYNWITGVGKLWVYPGTEIYENMKQNGLIDDSFWMSNKAVPYYTVEYNIDELIRFENKILDSVSIDRILTWNGFQKHFMKMPLVIIKYLYSNKRFILIIIGASLKRNIDLLRSGINNLISKLRGRHD